MTHKPTIPDVLEQFRAYRARPGNGAWGSLHVILDDGNVRDCFVTGCIESAAAAGDVEGERLARILLEMSVTQRRKLGTLL